MSSVSLINLERVSLVEFNSLEYKIYHDNGKVSKGDVVTHEDVQKNYV